MHGRSPDRGAYAHADSTLDPSKGGSGGKSFPLADILAELQASPGDRPRTPGRSARWITASGAGSARPSRGRLTGSGSGWSRPSATIASTTRTTSISRRRSRPGRRREPRRPRPCVEVGGRRWRPEAFRGRRRDGGPARGREGEPDGRRDHPQGAGPPAERGRVAGDKAIQRAVRDAVAAANQEILGLSVVQTEFNTWGRPSSSP